jgi:hypothetical protein
MKLEFHGIKFGKVVLRVVYLKLLLKVEVDLVVESGEGTMEVTRL